MLLLRRMCSAWYRVVLFQAFPSLVLCHLWFLWALWSEVGHQIKHRSTSTLRSHTDFSLFCLLFSLCPSPGYQISYRLDSRDTQRWTTVEVGSNARQFTVTGLSPEQTYVFRLTARTAVGWGEEQEAIVVTTERRGKGHNFTAASHWLWCAVLFVSLAMQNLSLTRNSWAVTKHNHKSVIYSFIQHEDIIFVTPMIRQLQTCTTA